jgi:hypothetical protein
MKTKTSKAKKRLPLIIIFSLIGLFLIAGGIAAYYLISRPDTTDNVSDDADYTPPGQQQIDSSQDGKKNSTPPTDDQNPDDETDKKTVNVGISYADIYEDNLEIRAFTNSVISGDGTCTATVKKGSQVITKSVSAFVDASSSQCRPIYIPSTQLDSGTWQITVRFSSPTSEGTSETVEVTI